MSEILLKLLTCRETAFESHVEQQAVDIRVELQYRELQKEVLEFR